MRVLILTPDIYTRGGIARYTATLASALGDLIGVGNVHVQPLLGAAALGKSFVKFRTLNPVTLRLTTASKFRFAARALGIGWSNYSLTVCTHIGLSPVAGLIGLFYGIPFWVTCHGSEAWPRFPADVRWALKRADLVLPVSIFTATRISKVNGIAQNKIRLLYNAIPDEFARMLSSSNGTNGTAADCNGKEKQILSVGKVSADNAYKGYDTVIKALPHVRNAIPNIRYRIVGEGDDIKRLKKLASEEGVGDHVEFKGGLPDAELAACYRECDVFALPSRISMNRRWEGEGFGRVYVEAAMAAKPVVGSIGGGAAEAVLHQKTGLLVDPTSVTEVVGALTRLLCGPELAAKMGREGRQWALTNFTSTALRRELAELLDGYGFDYRSQFRSTQKAAIATATVSPGSQHFTHSRRS